MLEVDYYFYFAFHSATFQFSRKNIFIIKPTHLKVSKGGPQELIEQFARIPSVAQAKSLSLGMS